MIAFLGLPNELGGAFCVFFVLPLIVLVAVYLVVRMVNTSKQRHETIV